MNKKRHIRNRVLACILAATMIVGEIPASTVRAAEETQAIQSSSADASVQTQPEEMGKTNSETTAATEMTQTETTETSTTEIKTETSTEIKTETSTEIKTETIETSATETETSTETTTETATETISETQSSELTDTQESDTVPPEIEEPSILKDTRVGYERSSDWDNLKNIKIIPNTYSAKLSADHTGSYGYDALCVIYTADKAVSDRFLAGKTRVSQTQLDDNEKLKMSGVEYLYDEIEEDESGNVMVKGSFPSGDSLNPKTKYYWRLAYCEDETGNYIFLTNDSTSVPFTTEAVLNSTASVTDLTVEDAGYHMVKIAWTVTNPDDEEITGQTVQLSADKTEYSDATDIIDEYYDENRDLIPGKYCVTVPFEYYSTYSQEIAKYARIKLDVRKENLEAVKYSGALTLTQKDISQRKFSVKVSKGTRLDENAWKAVITVEPVYEADGYDCMRFAYKKEGEKDYRYADYNVDDNSYADGKLSQTLILENIEDDALYQYYINTNNIDIYGEHDNPKVFSTGDITFYDDTDFPDAAFRKYIKRAIGLSEDDSSVLRSDQLAKVTEFNFPSNDNLNYYVIKSIKGIELMPNLTSINLSGHEIMDADAISSLTKLISIDFSNNVLIKLPDMSGMTELRSANFDKNMIPGASITADKLPAGFLTANPKWIENTKAAQNAGVSCKAAPKYYPAQKNGQTVWPFIVQVENLKANDADRRYTLSLTIGGKTVSKNNLSYDSYGMYCIPDISTDIDFTKGTKYSAAIKLTDNYGRVWLNAEKDLTFGEDEGDIKARKVYTSTGAKECTINIDGFAPNTAESDIKSVILKDKTGMVGKADLTNNSFYVLENSHPYQDVFENFSPREFTFPQRKNTGISIYFSKYLAAGNYSAELTMADNTVKTFTDIVCVQEGAALNGLYQASGDYDHFGQYLYVELNGANIDADKVYPEFYKDDKVISRLISASDISGDGSRIVYKLEKSEPETYWKIPQNEECIQQSYRIKKKDTNYSFQNNIGNGTLWYWYSRNSFSNDSVLYERYDSSTGKYIVKLDSRIPANANMTVEVREQEGGTIAARATGTVTADRWLSLSFKNGTKQYIPPYGDLFFKYTYSGKSFTHRGWRSDFGFWDDYNPNGSGYQINNKTAPAELNGMELKIYGSLIPNGAAIKFSKRNGNSSVYTPVNAVTTLTKKGAAADGYQTYTVTRTSGVESLAEGEYDVKYNNNIITWFHVYNNDKFYMHYQSVGKWEPGNTEGGIGADVSFSSKTLLDDHKNAGDGKTAKECWESNGYKLEIFDAFKQKIEGWTLESADWYAEDSLSLKVKGLKAGYTGYYFRITKNNLTGLYLGTDGEYYSSKEVGKWHTIGYRIFYKYLYDQKQCYAIGTDSKAAYPLTLTFTLSGDIDAPKKTLTIERPTSPKKQRTDTGREYYFTAADLQGLVSNKTYKLRVADKDGNILDCSGEGYFGVWSGTPYTAGIQLNKAALSLDLTSKREETLTITGKEASDTVTWSSSDESIATVDADGKVTAVAVGVDGSAGTATITAKVNEGTDEALEFTCAVTVTNNTLTGITLDKTSCRLNISAVSTLAKKETETLTVNFVPDNTTLSRNITWSSSNNAVATVANGVVTAVGAGTATITAKSSNNKTKTCTVTVVNYGISKPSLSLDLASNAAKTATLAVTGKAANDTVEWSSSDESIATVDANGKVTAANVGFNGSTGTATITAAVKDIAAQEVASFICPVTVTKNILTKIELKSTDGQNITSCRLAPNASQELTVSFTPTDTTVDRNITWTNSNSNVVTVASDGSPAADGTRKATLTASSSNVGTAVITATWGSGSKAKRATCTVIVTDYKLDGMKNKTKDLALDLKSQKSYQLKITNGESPYSNVAWSSNNRNVATVDTKGNVTAAGEGNAIITAQVKEGNSIVQGETFTINVTVTNNWIAMSESGCTLNLGGNTGNTGTLKLNSNVLSKINNNDVIWSSSKESVASVAKNDSGIDERSATITAVGVGETTITAEAKVDGINLEAKCKVKVMSVTTDGEAKTAAGKIKLTALTNVQPKLENVTPPTGWEWVNGNIDLKSFSGGKSKKFAARYYGTKVPDDKTYYQPGEAALEVTVATVTGVKINAENCDTLNVMEASSTPGTLSFEWITDVADFDIEEYHYTTDNAIRWTVPNKSAVSLSAPQGQAILGNGTVLGKKANVTLVAPGTATVTLKVATTDKPAKNPYKADYTMKVVQEPASITVSGTDGFNLTDDASGEADFSKVKAIKLTASVTNATALTAVSSDTKIIAIKKTAGTADNKAKTYNGTIELTVKAAGTAVITLKANDAANTSKTVTLKVTDPTPRISTDAMTINLQKNEGEMFYLYAHEEYSVTSADKLVYNNAQGADAPFTITYDNAKGGWMIEAADGAKALRTPYNLKVVGKATKTGESESEPYAIPLKITVVNTPPKYTVTQPKKLNLFYTGIETELKVDSKETITGVELKDKTDQNGNVVNKCAFEVTKGKGTDVGKYFIKVDTTKSDYKPSQDKTGKLTITFADYKDVTRDLTVSVEDKAPTLKLGSTAATLYPGADKAVVSVTKDGKPWEELESGAVDSYEVYKGKNKIDITSLVTVDNSKLSINAASYIASLTKPESLSLKINLKGTNWRDAVPLTYTLNLNPGTPALKLSKTKLTLNTHPDFYADASDTAQIMWNDGAEFKIDSNNLPGSNGYSIRFEAANAKDSALLRDSLDVAYKDGYITAKPKTSNIKSGNYSFKAIVTKPASVGGSESRAEKAFTLKIDNKVPVFTLTKPTLKLNVNTAFRAYDIAETKLGWNGTANLGSSRITIEDNNDLRTRNIIAGGVKLEYDPATQVITAKLLRGDIPKGTYKFKVMRNGSKKIKDINVTVINEAPDKSITLSQTGSIDVLDRENTSVTVTPYLKSVNGKVMNAELVAGGDAYAFNASFNAGNGKVTIKAVNDAKLIIGYDYKVRLKLTLANGIEYTTPEIKLSLKQGTPKVTIAADTDAVFFSGISRDRTFTVTPPTGISIDEMEPQNYKTEFTSTYNNGKLTISSKDTTAKGTYKLKFKVTFTGQADNGKATFVDCSVTVK